MTNLFRLVVLAALVRRVDAINHQALLDLTMNDGKPPYSNGNSASPGADHQGSFFDIPYSAPLPTPKPTPYPTEKPTSQPIVEPSKPPTQPSNLKPIPEPVYTPLTPAPKPVNPPTFEPTIYQQPQPTPEPTKSPTEPPTLYPTSKPTKAPFSVTPPTFDPTTYPQLVPVPKPPVPYPPVPLAFPNPYPPPYYSPPVALYPPPSPPPTIPPFTQEPTKAPTVPPTLAPTLDPTESPFSPVPKPVNPPTFNPTTNPQPIPVPEPPIIPPTYSPIPLPSLYSPPHDAPPVTSYTPPPPPPSMPTFTQPVYSTDPPVKIDTRTTTYKAKWGAVIEHCEYLNYNTIFNCHDGGIITPLNSINAICRKLSEDYMQCRQNELQIDSFVDFTCSGIKHSHLMVTASVGPSPAWNCAKDGNAVKYLTISRVCNDEYGVEYLDKHPECEVGQPWTQNNVEYCASSATCQVENGNCKTLSLPSVTMGHPGKDLECSRVDPTSDLQQYSFKESRLRSVNQVDWRFSGMGRGCHWEAPPLLLRCENGGQLDLLEPYEFCQLYPPDNMAFCRSFAPFSVENEERKAILVSCSGKNETQLALSVEIPSEKSDVQCKHQGIAVQRIMLTRGCGEFGTNGFGFVNDPSFCSDESQLYIVDKQTSYCSVGNTCSTPDGCDNLQLPVVVANTGTDMIGHCIYGVLK